MAALPGSARLHQAMRVRSKRCRRASVKIRHDAEHERRLVKKQALSVLAYFLLSLRLRSPAGRELPPKGEGDGKRSKTRHTL